MDKSISVIIPVRNKEIERLKEVIKRLDDFLIKEVIIVDYYSKKKEIPLLKSLEKDSKVRMIRYNKKSIWNKAHAINIGVKYSTSRYIMTLDADILLSANFFEKLKGYLSEDNFIYTNKVKRIKKKDLTDNWKNNLKKSFDWNKNETFYTEAHHLATGGVQIFPKWWFKKIRGLDENLIYYGGMDNITIIKAKKEGLNLVILNDTILHLEHKNQKEDNLPKNERIFAKFVKKDRWNLMKLICSDSYKQSSNYGSLGGPQDNLISVYRKTFEKIKDKLDDEGNGRTKILNLPRDTKIMIAVINNKSVLPELFVRDLIPLYMETKRLFPKTEIKFVKSCQVNNMRNIAVTTAINEGYDYLIQLDDDHKYPSDTIIRLLSHKKNFVTGCTRQRIVPYLPTQFYKFKNPIKQEGNFVKAKGNEGLLKIECSGPVGMLMKVSELIKLDYPYYWIDYHYNSKYTLEKGKEAWTYYPQFISNYLGGDYKFCQQLLNKGIELWLDTSLDFPHIISGVVDALSDDEDAIVRLDDGKL